MTIIVTGGAGFIGGNFIHYYLAEHPDDRVVCVDKLTYAGNLSTLAPVMEKENFKFYRVDICDREKIYGIFEEEKPDVVINFAAESHVDRSISNPMIFVDTNVRGTVNLLQCCKEAWYDAGQKTWKPGKKWTARIGMRAETAEIQKAIAALPLKKSVVIMEVCGTHTMAIARNGIKSMLPEKVNLLSGPGCPVCVTPAGVIDRILELAMRPVLIFYMS